LRHAGDGGAEGTRLQAGRSPQRHELRTRGRRAGRSRPVPGRAALGPLRLRPATKRTTAMSDPSFFEAIARDLTGPGMFGGKFQFRLILQPLAAIILGLRYGMRDAKAGESSFLHSLATAKGGRGVLLKGAIRAALVPLILAV